MACPCLSLVPVSRVLKERSISSNSGDVDHDVLAELLVSGLEVFEDGCELQERSMNHWDIRASWFDVRAVPHKMSPSGLHLCVIVSATVSDTCNESVNPFVARS